MNEWINSINLKCKLHLNLNTGMYVLTYLRIFDNRNRIKMEKKTKKNWILHVI